MSHVVTICSIFSILSIFLYQLFHRLIMSYGQLWCRFPNSNTAVTFYCLLDPRGLKEGEYVFLNGSLDVLSAWEGGVPMERTEDNEDLWCVTVELPLSKEDRATTVYTGGYVSQGAGDGLFQYRYEIRLAQGDTENRADVAASTPDGSPVIIEGQMERIEHSLKLQYFDSFRPNHKFRRFKGWTLSSKSVFQQYVQHNIFRFQQGEPLIIAISFDVSPSTLYCGTYMLFICR